MEILILNGPNLNLLGLREPEIYGHKTLDEVIGELRYKYSSQINLDHFQTNHEGVLIDKIHEFGFASDGIILNAGAYTHNSIALADAVKAVTTPVVEVHISDIFKREKFRQHSYLTPVVAHHIIGQGVEGYELALKYLIKNANKKVI